ncbi:hypothetical protein ECANGB1_907 [Enterospora canceri]|uniref:Uncharacterized protein n=1 Tax=Enterospora canceri TaxID=1081671 RepID=A0A1Y1S761_9MICR|nr:hypothetical protein ECANGB1_907 [Enterospora canceri]
MKNIQIEELQLRVYLQSSELSYDKICKIGAKYRGNYKIQELLGRNLFKQECYGEAALWFYFLYKRKHSAKYRLLSWVSHEMNNLQKEGVELKRNETVFDDQAARKEHVGLFLEPELDKMCNIDLFRDQTINGDVIIDDKWATIDVNDNYKTNLAKLRQFYCEDTNLKLINYLLVKDVLNVTRIKELRFLHNRIEQNIKKNVYQRLFKYLFHDTLPDYL